MLRVRGLVAGYGRIQVLHGIDLELEPGEVVALLGRNGAGKSTLLKALIGIVPVQKGEILFEGRPIAGLPPYRRAQLGLGYVPEERRIFPELSVRENLELAARPGGPWTVDRVFELFPRLAEIEGRPGGYLSGGEQQMLTLARTLVTNPKLLLLDEPTEGLAPILVQAIAETVAELKASGMPILLAEQNLAFTARLADRGYVLETGEVRREGPIEALVQDPRVKELLAL
ncbi:MAG TPA: ABC transporter ATP-binding protein [Oceanithermus sp.]|nr:ABC transporter ATP-binding protein [Oceanithermus sp.]